VTILPGSPEGEAPALRRTPSEAADTGIVLSEIRQLLRQGLEARQIALIGVASRENGSLSRYSEVDGVPLIDDAGDWRRGGGILVTTARAFKGLEADIVIVYGLSTFGSLFTKTDLYVAWTRARHRLIIVCHGSEVRAVVEAALAECERDMQREV
jgi:DNA helicase IV